MGETREKSEVAYFDRLLLHNALPSVLWRSILGEVRPSGGMADALDSKSSGETRVGSSPTLATLTCEQY